MKGTVAVRATPAGATLRRLDDLVGRPDANGT